MNRTKQLKEIKTNLKTAVENHEKFKNAYHWSPSSHASGRRRNEKNNNFSFESSILDIYVENKYSESCRNVYYKGVFFVDGKKTTVTKIKNIISALEKIC